MSEDAQRSRHRLSGRRGIVAAAAGALAVLGAVATGCGPGPDSGGPPGTPTSAASPTERPTGTDGTADGLEEAADLLPRSAPVGLEIPAIDVDTERTTALGVQGNGEIEVPEDGATVGWYEGGPTPGEFGPALMGAHVDSETGPALFYDLADLVSGDEVRVEREDGTTAVFTVYSVEQHPKSDFPTRKVYAPTGDRAELRLVTCGGTFDDGTGHYRDNIVVYARMTGTE